jgi:hypothetical protein
VCTQVLSLTELFLLRSDAVGICFAVSGSSSIYRRLELGPLANRALGAEFFPERLHPRVQAGLRQGVSLPAAAAGCLLSFSTTSGFHSQREFLLLWLCASAKYAPLLQSGFDFLPFVPFP